MIKKFKDFAIDTHIRHIKESVSKKEEENRDSKLDKYPSKRSKKYPIQLSNWISY